MTVFLDFLQQIRKQNTSKTLLSTRTTHLYNIIVHGLLGRHPRIGHPRLVPPVQRRLQLTVIQAAVPAYLHLALDVHAERVRELEGVEEGVRDDGGAVVGALRLQEPADHLRAEDAAVLVRQLDHVGAAVARHARLHPHVELAWGRTDKGG